MRDPRSGSTTYQVPGRDLSRPVIEVVLPVYNEQRQLADSVRRVLTELDLLPWPARLVIADNASTDGTPFIARRLAVEDGRVSVLRLGAKGRGRALRTAWSRSEADVLVYMDIDLSTDLSALLPLVAPLVSGHSDVAIGTRLARTSRVVRSPAREVTSRCYNLLLHGVLQVGFSDAQCGFKAVRREVAQELLPWVEDEGWFFDTELLVLAERAGLRIHEVPVDWVEDPESSVRVASTAVDDVLGVVRVGADLALGRVPVAEIAARLGRQAPSAGTGGQVLRFAVTGVVSTLLYTVLFVLGRAWWPAQLAHFVALLLATLANTALNRRFTFGVRGHADLVRQHLAAVLVLVAGLLLSSAALALVAATHAGVGWEVVAVTFANLMSTVLRFAAMKWWIFHRRPTAPTAPAGARHTRTRGGSAAPAARPSAW
ncbi:MAG: hypothetical protein DCC50_06770 [Acidobacteria bacterium]|nr:MAG: hypothetical protein DCC50_06770 [Acidobacteriota bacterium]